MASLPNIILIITDHWRGDCFGHLGHPVAETPHLDSLSRRGISFTRAYVPSASCIPARRSLVSGQTPNRTGFLGYHDYVDWDYPQTMAGELRNHGYQTINVGKTHYYPRRACLGYEVMITPEDYADWLSRHPLGETEKLGHGVHGNSWMARPNHLPERLSEEHWFVGQAEQQLTRRDPQRPFFLTLSFNGPHPPWCPPQVYYDQFIDRPLPPPIVGDWAAHHAEEAGAPLDANTWRGRLPDHLNQRARAGYFGYLAFLDAQVGRLINFLQRSPAIEDWRNTLFVFTSDHGEMLGDHNLWRKSYAYEASARVPFLVIPPAGLPGPRGTHCDALVGWEDLMPTLLDLVGAPIPEQVEGRSLCPWILGEIPDEWRAWYHHEHSPCYSGTNANQALIGSRWKYIWNPITGDEQLFDLEQDPEERHDLVDDPGAADTLAEWRQTLATHLAGRPENLSDGQHLTPGHVPAWRGLNKDG